MRKFKIFYDFEAEEEYLNSMAKQGHILKNYSVFGFYQFTEGKPQDLNYKIDYRKFKNKREFADYITLFEDAGWKHICGTKDSGSQFFLPITEQAGTDIFSDHESSALRYKSLYQICTMNVSIFVCYFTVVMISSNYKLSNLGFLTPGLWERKGFDFWFGFLFELPFVLFRVLPPFLFVVAAIFYAYWGTKAKKLYELRKEKLQ